ncbi:MAG: hypothetical protein ACYSUV_10295 [Planctomycetota bacterium]|jgi:uncharacterized coiled-coil DUF342 family protein
MGSNFAEISVVVSADTKGLEKGLSKSTSSLKKFSSNFNKDFIGGMTKGTATTKDFGAQLLRAGDQAGLGTSQISKMAGATGIFTDKQLLAGTASAKMAEKAQALTAAVKSGTMTTRQAGKEFGKLADEQKVLADSTKSTKDKFMDMGKSMLQTAAIVGGVGFAVYQAGKQIYEVGKRGAMVTQTADSFEYLSTKLALPTDLLEQLRKESRGTIDDFKLMSSTATLLAGTSDKLGKALGTATPELMRIAKAANKLNPSLGTTSHMYESIALGIKRASPMILDNLGLTIKIGDANEKMAESLGKSVDALTAEEKQMALLNATLAAGENLINQVGGSTESATDAYEQNSAALANMKDLMSQTVNEGINPMVSALAEFYSGAIPARDAYQMLLEAMDNGVITTEELVDLDRQMADGLIDLAELTAILEQAAIRHALAVGTQGSAVQQTDYHVSDHIGTIEEATIATEELAEATVDLKAQQKALTMWMQGPLGNEYDSFYSKQDDLIEQIGELEDQLKGLGDEEYIPDKNIDQVTDLKNELGGVIGEIWDLDQALEEGELNQIQGEEARLSIENLRLEAGELERQIIALGGVPYTTDEQQLEIDETKGKLDELNQKLEENKRAHEEATKAMLFNIAAAHLSTEAQTELAWELGLIDTKTFQATTSIASLTEKYDLNKDGVIDLSEMTDEYIRDVEELKRTIDGIPHTLTKTLIFQIRKYGTAPDWEWNPYTEETVDYTPPPPKAQHPDHRHRGGPVAANMPYIVGEKGPELFVPNASGSIIPHNDLLTGAPSGWDATTGLGGGMLHQMPYVNDAMLKASMGLMDTFKSGIANSSPALLKVWNKMWQSIGMTNENTLKELGGEYGDFFEIMRDQFRDGYVFVEGEWLEILDFMQTNLGSTKEEMVGILNALGKETTEGWAHYMYLLEDSTREGFTAINDIAKDAYDTAMGYYKGIQDTDMSIPDWRDPVPNERPPSPTPRTNYIDPYIDPFGKDSGTGYSPTPRTNDIDPFGRYPRTGHSPTYIQNNNYIQSPAAAAWIVEQQHQAEFDEIGRVI